MQIILIILWLTNGDINGSIYQHTNMDNCESHRELLVEIHGDNHLLSQCVILKE